MVESSYMQYYYASHLGFPIPNISTINSLARIKSMRSHAIHGRKITLNRLQIPLSVGIIVILLQMVLLSNLLPMRFPANIPKQWCIPSNRLGFHTPEPKWAARDSAMKPLLEDASETRAITVVRNNRCPKKKCS